MKISNLKHFSTLKHLTKPFLLLVIAASAIASDAPRVPRNTLAATERKLDNSFTKLWSDNPFVVLGPTRGVYLEGYGAVFTAEVNLVAGPTLAKALADTAASPEMAAVPPDEQIVLVAFLSHFPWEDLDGLPAQIAMQGSKKQLMEAQHLGGAALESAIHAVQY